MQPTPPPAAPTLDLPEAWLEEACAAEAALDALDAAPRVETLQETLAAAGFGPPVIPRAADVLARLKEKAAAQETPA